MKTILQLAGVLALTAGLLRQPASALPVAGVVLGPDGKPAAGVLVQVIAFAGGREAEGKTDAEGKFSLVMQNLSGGGADMVPCVVARDLKGNLAAARELDSNEESVELKLEPGLLVSGRAVCDGKPVTNASAAVVFWSGRSGRHIQGWSVAKENGGFEIPAMPAGRKYGLIVTAPGYGQKTVQNLDSSVESRKLDLDVVELKAANLRLAGKVVDDSDQPVAKAHVNISGSGQPMCYTNTDSEGLFSFEHVCEGIVQIHASGNNAYGNKSAEGGETNVVVKLGASAVVASVGNTEKAHKVRGVIKDSDGKLVAGALIKVFPGYNSSWVKSATNGEYKLSWSLPPWRNQSGEAMLVVRHPKLGLAGLKEISEDTTNQDMVLSAAVTLAGLVQTPEKKSIANAEVGVWFHSGNSYDQWDESETHVDSEGRYRIAGLPAEGAFRVYAQAPERGRAEIDVETTTATNLMELDVLSLKAADRILVGQVINAQDKPESGVNVSLSGDGQPSTSATTDSQGRFKFKVCEGTVNLWASAQSAYGQANAEAGDTNVVIQIGNGSSEATRESRASLAGKALPDLAAFGLTAESLPGGKRLLLALFDLEQRPSRHALKQLAELASSLKDKGVVIAAIQSTVISADDWKAWKEANTMPFPVGRLADTADSSKWVSRIDSIPWLILTDANRKVVSEGFALEELDAKLKGAP
jgi:hypothetical protein